MRYMTGSSVAIVHAIVIVQVVISDKKLATG